MPVSQTGGLGSVAKLGEERCLRRGAFRAGVCRDFLLLN